jgi:hypothetical protein
MSSSRQPMGYIRLTSTICQQKITEERLRKNEGRSSLLIFCSLHSQTIARLISPAKHYGFAKPAPLLYIGFLGYALT